MDSCQDLPQLIARLEQLCMNGNDRTVTENMAGAFTTTGDKCLDFFASVVRDTSVSTVITQFVASWNENPEKALKLLLNLRDVREGKGEKKLPLVLMYFLSCWKPLTYLANMKHFLKVGCFKDLMVIAELAVRCKEVKYFDRIPQLEAERVELMMMSAQLLKDEMDLTADAKAGISLCAKWAPTENTHYDSKPLRFARKATHTMGLKKKEYRQKLTKLRQHLKVLERMMCNNEWDQIVFKSLPAKAHRLYRGAFKRDTNAKNVESDARHVLAERYEAYLEELTAGKTSIKSTGTQPHELIKPYLHEPEGDATIEGQWNDMIAKLAENGNFKHVQAVCDVSGSMDGIPMEVSIALGLVVAELAEAPFKNKLITFSSEPAFYTVDGKTLWEKVHQLKAMPWGMNTNLLKVFEVLLEQTVKNPGAKMVEKLFIFSDMQFDAACSSNWMTTYQSVQHMYSKKGFQVPLIIFWNLRATKTSFPVTKDQCGTCLVSGFSAQLMKTFLEAKDFNPVNIMDAALEKYEIAPPPKSEHTAFPVGDLWKDSINKVEGIVAEFLVPKSSKNKKRRGAAGGDSADSDTENSDEEME